MDNQVTLQNNYNNINTSNPNIFGKRDSIWKTIEFFYNAQKNKLIGLTSNDVREAHSKLFRIHPQMIVLHLLRLEREKVIQITAENLGKTKRMKMYQITDYGIWIFENGKNNQTNGANI